MLEIQKISLKCITFLQFYILLVVPFIENYAAGIHNSDFSSFLFLTGSLKSHLLFSSYSTFVNLNPYTFLIYFVIMPTRKEAPWFYVVRLTFARITSQPATNCKRKIRKNLSSLREFRMLIHDGENFKVFIFQEGYLHMYWSPFFFFCCLSKLWKFVRFVLWLLPSQSWLVYISALSYGCQTVKITSRNVNMKSLPFQTIRHIATGHACSCKSTRNHYLTIFLFSKIFI